MIIPRPKVIDICFQRRCLVLIIYGHNCQFVHVTCRLSEHKVIFNGCILWNLNLRCMRFVKMYSLQSNMNVIGWKDKRQQYAIWYLFSHCLIKVIMCIMTSLQQLYTRQKKRNAPLRTVQLSGRSNEIGQFSLCSKQVCQVLLRQTPFAIWRRNCVMN